MERHKIGDPHGAQNWRKIVGSVFGSALDSPLPTPTLNPNPEPPRTPLSTTPLLFGLQVALRTPQTNGCFVARGPSHPLHKKKRKRKKRKKRRKKRKKKRKRKRKRKTKKRLQAFRLKHRSCCIAARARELDVDGRLSTRTNLNLGGFLGGQGPPTIYQVFRGP